MWIRTLTLSLALGTGLVAGPALAGIHAPEEAIETSTAEVILPRNVGGALLAKPCAVCQPITVRLESDTRLLIGEQEVSLAEFNQFLSSGGPYGLTIFYDKKSFVMNRIAVSAQFRRK
ncbi:MAG TPA: hypothetical protein VIH25_05185 [Steroidobacteraceae bacterium]